jgi:2'-5' RNA ligase
MARLFLALWPDAAARNALYCAAQAAHQEGGGRLIRPDNLHQTLVFLGSIATERITALKAAAGDVAGSAFTLDWGATGYWRHNRIIWAAPHAMPAPLVSLVDTLVQVATSEGVACDDRPYRAHVTLVRDARAPAALPALRFTWQVRDFALVESGRDTRGVAYRVIGRWPLGD